MMARTDESVAYIDSSSLRFTARAGRGAHGAEEPVGILLADRPEGLDVMSAEELDNADPAGRGRGMTDFTDSWTSGGVGSTDGSMAAAAFLFRNVKRPQGQNNIFLVAKEIKYPKS
jgi:hypothetical protein